MSDFVMFHTTIPGSVIERSLEVDPHSMLDWPASAHISLAVQLARQKQPVMLYVHPLILESPSHREGLIELGKYESEIRVAADGRNIEDALDTGKIKTCVIYHGDWAFKEQAKCRLRNIAVVLLEQSPFLRNSTLFMDPIGVSHLSSLAAFSPAGLEPDDTERTLVQLREEVNAEQYVEEPYILLLLERSDSVYFPYEPRYRHSAEIIGDLSRRFPDHKIAVRPHPHEVERVSHALPDNCFLADKGNIAGWAKHCSWAVGFNSKSMFMPLLFERPVVTLARGMMNFFQRSTIFVDANVINDLSESNIFARFNAASARQFVSYMLREHHVRILTDDMEEINRNKNSIIYNRLLLPSKNI